jgi:hypothetical protein
MASFSSTCFGFRRQTTEFATRPPPMASTGLLLRTSTMWILHQILHTQFHHLQPQMTLGFACTSAEGLVRLASRFLLLFLTNKWCSTNANLYFTCSANGVSWPAATQAPGDTSTTGPSAAPFFALFASPWASCKHSSDAFRFRVVLIPLRIATLWRIVQMTTQTTYG